MLVLSRESGQWVEIIHEKSGDTIYVKLFDVEPGCQRCGRGRASLAFDDPDRLFEINRPERLARKAEERPPSGRRAASHRAVTIDTCRPLPGQKELPYDRK